MDIRCPAEQIIVTSSAKFGRMEYNECILVRDLIGCENDVLFAVDRWCSGRQVCQIKNPTKKLEETNKNCLAYLRKYLQITYSCLKGKCLVFLVFGDPELNQIMSKLVEMMVFLWKL